jgi:cystathionine gamma-synthase
MSSTPPSGPPAATHPSTLAVRAAIGTDVQHGAVVPPIHLTTTFTFDGLEGKRPYDYTRSGNPTRDQLGEALAAQEGGRGGVVTSTGMSALTLVVQLLRAGELLIAPHDCYGGTYRLLRSLAARGHFVVAFHDLTAPDAAATIRARRPRMLLVETPSNPLLRITDIAAVAEASSEVGATVVADNTFLSPALQRPLELGADVVVHSTTKYLNGHSDVVGGAVIARDNALLEELTWWANCLGLTGAPFDAYLTLRGLRTLHVRMRQHLDNAGAVVDALCSHPVVRHVHYPGLRGHPGHAIAARQQRGFGAMVSFELDGGAPAVRAFVDGLRCFSLAESLGGVESLIAHPSTMTHASMDAAAQAAAGIGPTLLRLSVGIEATEDLVADVEAGLERAAGAAGADGASRRRGDRRLGDRTEADTSEDRHACRTVGDRSG